ncbi:hypothetical protein Theco_1545 [Thermobacillus composti KWC4]|uniref:Uncharacterized protein n=1 Tax=Thermobacillus composti (strain DSM 18247 / JCM 13945 / KWC4) TaxID=717605 RepID=L0EDH7_THECK|nr:glycoside hydrolase family 95 protein [Thermobacillus composti]AGA57684.1 hypothetical protein Theco_1545 [Thermobacillus composti KWC4]
MTGKWDRLWYRRPAGVWEEALPIGNGRLGAMLFGGVRLDRILLNEDTLWAGYPRETVDCEARRHLARARELIFAGRLTEAQRLIESRMTGRNVQPYLPLGELAIEWLDGEDDAPDYVRSLRIFDGVADVRFASGGLRMRRAYWASAPDQVIVVRYEAEGGMMNLAAALSSPVRSSVSVMDDGRTLVLAGRAPSHVADNWRGDHPEPVLYEEGRGMRFEARVRLETDGVVEAEGERLIVRGASRLTAYIAAATAFVDWRTPPDESGAHSARCEAWLREAERSGYEALLERHLADHRAFMGRVSLRLAGGEAAGLPDADSPGSHAAGKDATGSDTAGSDAVGSAAATAESGQAGMDRSEAGWTASFGLNRVSMNDLPTDERLKAYQSGNPDPALEALYFQYGRYLLLASSRPGTQPANLQGIWNPHVQPPWFSDYTININTEMNYWPAEVCNLSECHEPLFAMLGELAESGTRTARIHYGCRGWTAHHNVDLWRMSTPSDGSASWAFWPMGGAWLATHLWERYLFEPDLDFLRGTAYPLMRGAAQFCLDWLVPGPDGTLVTNPSTSPENVFLTPEGEPCSVTWGSTMDMAIIRELFAACIEASRLLGTDEPLRGELEAALAKLPPYRIGRHGQLQEWAVDYDEHEPGHRHVSHLFGLFPGSHLNETTPELLEAARVTLERRLKHGGGHTGWSCAWLILLYARLKDAETARGFIRTLLARSTYPNLLDAHPPFQIDGNFGGAAGIAELLVQSHLGSVDLLPALPADWRSGEVRGLHARGGFTIDIAWADGTLREARITSRYGKPLRVRHARPVAVYGPDGALLLHLAPGEAPPAIDTAKGGVYRIVPV